MKRVARMSIWVFLGASVLGMGLFGQGGTRHVVPSESMPTFISPVGDLGFTILLDQTSVGSDTALSLGTFLPGATVPEHTHQGSAEILYMLNGAMEMTIGTRKMVARAGSAIYIPPDTPHSATVLGKIEPVKVVQVYSPGGPEQRFKEWEPEG
jgi:quercetin dioxygenase-like cupin family protein